MVSAVEPAAVYPGFVGASWFTGVDEPVLSTTEDYTIGFRDAADRPYPEIVDAAKETHGRLCDVHSARAPPFSRKPLASEAGTPTHRRRDAF